MQAAHRAASKLRVSIEYYAVWVKTSHRLPLPSSSSSRLSKLSKLSRSVCNTLRCSLSSSLPHSLNTACQAHSLLAPRPLNVIRQQRSLHPQRIMGTNSSATVRAVEGSKKEHNNSVLQRQDEILDGKWDMWRDEARSARFMLDDAEFKKQLAELQEAVKASKDPGTQSIYKMKECCTNLSCSAMCNSVMHASQS